ncbi:MAG: VWA domain-containing protein [Gammaproteobacteria bacterium]
MSKFTVKSMACAILVLSMACTQTDQQVAIEPGIQKIPAPVEENEVLSHLEDEFKQSSKMETGQREHVKRKIVSEIGRANKPDLPMPAMREMEAMAYDYSAPATMAYSASGPVAQGSVSLDVLRLPSEPVNRENYAHYDDNPVKLVTEHPLSTFSIDVDTGAYANVRRMLNAGALPPRDAVRAEELINYFSYAYQVPADNTIPFSLVREIAPSPWNTDSYLLHLGIKGYALAAEKLPPANLVFLVDVSGSMQSADKLGLLKTSLKLLTKHLAADDRVSIVVYAGATGIVLEPTQGSQKATIIASLDRLTAGGRTNGAAGIRLAYAVAEQAFIKDGINRVLLATDGDFNVGTVDHEQLKNLIEEKRKSGISLSTLGFGTGNYNDHLMEQLADTGNGNYAYIDTLNEAQKVLVDEMSSTMMTIAKDVKIQIEFNPAVVAEYRLLGYENRLLQREDFNNDKVDAGDIGAGHSVTALYEITFNNSKGKRIDPLRYRQDHTRSDLTNNEIAFLRLRYKQPDANESQLLEWPVGREEIITDIDQTTNAFRFSAAVAAFAQQLRGGKFTADFGYPEIRELAGNARGKDPFGYRGEFLSLVNMAQSLSATAVTDGNKQRVSINSPSLDVSHN